MRTTILLAAIAIASTTALAADPQTSSEKTGAKMRAKFDAADTDHDGLLTRDEAAKGMPRAAKHFDAMDADHDGKLSMREIAQFMHDKRAARGQDE